MAKPMVIKNLCPGLAEVGKIKIGMKGAMRKSSGGNEFQPPQKLDHFLITTMERGADGNYIVDQRLMDKFGKTPRVIPVRLVYDDLTLNFATRYICYYGKTVFCSGDGETAMRLQQDKTYAERTCPCQRQDPKYNGDNGPNGGDCLGGTNQKGKCKINGILSVIIDGADMVGGVWKFRTTSYNSVVGILSSLALISRVSGGRLAGIPLNMTVAPKTTQDPINGTQVTIQVVGLQFAGNMEMLRHAGYQIAMDEAKHGISMQQIEEQAKMMIVHDISGSIGDDSDDDVVEEFYPEEAGTVVETQVVSEEAAQVVTRERGKPSPGAKRRTAAEIEEDRLADEADALAAQGQVKAHPDGTITLGAPVEQTVTETVDEETGEITGGNEEPPFIDDREQEPEYGPNQQQQDNSRDLF